YQGGVVNAPAARIMGAEAEGQFLLPAHLSATANMAVLGGHFTESFRTLDSVAANAATQAVEAQGFSFFSPQDFAARAGAIADIDSNPVPKLSHFSSTVALEHKL